MASTAIDYQRSGMSSALATCVLIFAGLFALVAVGYGLDAIAPRDPTAIDPALAAQFITPSALHPKPHDRFMFPAVAGIGFVLLALVIAVWRERVQQPFDPRAAFFFCAGLAGALALWLGLWDGLHALFSRPQLSKTLACLAISAATAWVSMRGGLAPARRWLLATTYLLSILFIAATRIFTYSRISYDAYITSHYEAAVYSIVHVAGGGTCLADVLPQYGCYGEFIAPIVQIFGASPLVITLVFVVLQSLAMLSIMIFSASLIRSTALLLTAIGCVTILTSIILMLGSPDPYFQYNPIRLLFPALSLLCVLAIQRHPSLPNAMLIGAFAGASLAWNVDTGVAVFGGLGLFAFAVGFTEPGWLSLPPLMAGLKRLIGFIAGALIFLTVFYFYLEIKSGWHVNLAAAMTYQRAFYVAGLAMIPIPALPGLWTIAAVAIAIGLLAAMAGVASRSDKAMERVSYLAILSIGLMLYYSGRSHWLVLRFVVWPEVILFFYLADQSMKTSRANAKLATIGIAVFLPVAATVFFFPVWSTVIAGMWKPAPTSDLISQDIAFLQSLTTPGENIAIIAENQSTLYAASGTWPSVKGPSLAEMQFVRDRDLLRDDVAREGPKKLFVNFSPITPLCFASSIDLKSHYELRATGPGGRLLYFVRKD